MEEQPLEREDTCSVMHYLVVLGVGGGKRGKRMLDSLALL